MTKTIHNLTTVNMNTVRGIWLILMFDSFSTVIHGLQIDGAQQVKAITPAYKGNYEIHKLFTLWHRLGMKRLT